MNTDDHSGPLTGPYYWVPGSLSKGVAWELMTCHDLRVRDGVSHREFWPTLLEHLAVLWGKDAVVLKRRLRGHHTGLPRGRVVHPKSGYVVIHGDNAPSDGWLDHVKARFRLSSVDLTPEFTEHEGMIGDDLRAVEEALGVPLGLIPLA